MNDVDFLASEMKRTIKHIKENHTSGIDHKWGYLDKVVDQLIAVARENQEEKK